jgi:hypothetical protein
MVGLNFTFLRYFYVQGEYKLGYIHMWDIKTSPASTDRACQSIFYNQFMMVFGLNLYFSDFVKE